MSIHRNRITPISYGNRRGPSANVSNRRRLGSTGPAEAIWKTNDEVDVDQVTILPLIDLPASDYTCLYSVIQFVDAEVRRMKLPGTTLTFDQPLYIKSMEIVMAKGIKTVKPRMGGFHTLMSATGASFHLMRSSGIEEAMGQVYGPNAIGHIMTGKAIARALRALHLVEAALTSKLLEQILPVEMLDGDAEATMNAERMSMETAIEVQRLLTELYSEDSTSNALQSAIASESSNELDRRLQCLLTSLSSRSKTAKLWTQFLYHVDLIHQFVLAERTKSWQQHLTVCTQLLNLFASAGHLHYAKSVRLYVQTMRALPEENPWLHRQLTEGKRHAVQRTDHPLNGLWSDLSIEQILIRSLKSRGGLAHGRSMTESTRNQWVDTMHHRAVIHDAMSSLTNQHRAASEQHKDLGNARRQRDTSDLEKIIVWFKDHDPFSEEITELQSLSTGLVAHDQDGINCRNAEEIGAKIQSSLDGVSVNAAKIKRSEHVRTLQDLKPGVQLNGKTCQIDPSILFLRCCAISKRLDVDQATYFNYEMCTFPPSFFKDGYMRKADKADLARFLQKDMTNHADDEVSFKRIVLIDGGWLLHKVRWSKGATFAEILSAYISFIEKRFGLVTVVFDGYGKSSTKDHEHSRRTSATVKPTSDMQACSNQDAFLSNAKNKTELIKMLASQLLLRHHAVQMSEGDADIMLVQEAIRYDRNAQPVTVVANDTDVFVFLLHHWQLGMAQVFLHMEGRKQQSKVFAIDEVLLSPAQKTHILFLHALTGCDTTSACHGQGKLTLFRKISTCPDIEEAARLISSSTGSLRDIGNAGIRLFCIMYGACDVTDLANVRHTKLESMIATCSKLEPQKLPPTNRAAHFHALRVHLQVSTWASLEEVLEPQQYGWKDSPRGLQPIMTDLPPGPDEILKYIRCKCKSVPGRRCGSNLCSCKKNGLRCVRVCGGCRGEDCLNTEPMIHSDSDSDD